MDSAAHAAPRRRSVRRGLRRRRGADAGGSDTAGNPARPRAGSRARPSRDPGEPSAFPASGENFIEWSWNAVAEVSGYQVQFSSNEAFTEEDEVIARTAEQVSYRRGGARGRNERLPPRAVRRRNRRGGVGKRLVHPCYRHDDGSRGARAGRPVRANISPGVRTRGRLHRMDLDRVTGADGYQVQFSSNEAFTEEDEVIARTAEQVSYRREGLEAGTNAYLRVRSVAGTGEEALESVWSTHVTGMTTVPEVPAPVAPSAPTNLRVSERGDDYIEWTLGPGHGRGRLPGAVQLERGVHRGGRGHRTNRRAGFLSSRGARGRNERLPPRAVRRRNRRGGVGKRLVHPCYRHDDGSRGARAGRPVRANKSPGVRTRGRLHRMDLGPGHGRGRIPGPVQHPRRFSPTPTRYSPRKASRTRRTGCRTSTPTARDTFASAPMWAP